MLGGMLFTLVAFLLSLYLIWIEPSMNSELAENDTGTPTYFHSLPLHVLELQMWCHVSSFYFGPIDSNSGLHSLHQEP